MSYLYSSASLSSIPVPDVSRIQKSEFYTTGELVASSRGYGRQPAVLGTRAADALSVRVLRQQKKQLAALPVSISEDARKSLTSMTANRLRLAQDECYASICELSWSILHKMEQRGEDWTTLRIGGDGFNGVYETFFRVQPRQLMSLGQFLTALRLSLQPTADPSIRLHSSKGTKDPSASKDYSHRISKSAGRDPSNSTPTLPFLEKFAERIFATLEELDGGQRGGGICWRSFLVLWQPLLTPLARFPKLISLNYAIFGSVGVLDPRCSSPITVAQWRRIWTLTVPLSQRSSLESLLSDTWNTWLSSDKEAAAYVDDLYKAHSHRQALSGGRLPALLTDELPLTLCHIKQLHQLNPLSSFLTTALSYGENDSRTWYHEFEEAWYHPVLYQTARLVRRQARNVLCCRDFLRKKEERRLRFNWCSWQQYIRRRRALRELLIAAILRDTTAKVMNAFDLWRTSLLHRAAAIRLQRYIRGFLGRRRSAFLRRFTSTVTRAQAAVRASQVRSMYKRELARRRWAAIIIQRVVRGFQARGRVLTMVEEEYDRRTRRLAQSRKQFEEERYLRAVRAIQFAIRRALFRRKVLRRGERMALEAEYDQHYEDESRRALLAEESFKQQLTAWYNQQREEALAAILTAESTAHQRKMLATHRSLERQKQREARRLVVEQKAAQEKEHRITLWNEQWEEKIQHSLAVHREFCKAALAEPQTPEAIALRAKLRKDIKIRIPAVLREADKQRIPMEIPQATVLATEEAIEAEVASEEEKQRTLMLAEGQRILDEDAEEERKLKAREEGEKLRRSAYAIFTLQRTIRRFLANRRLQKIARSRFAKHFDALQHEYFYRDVVTGQTQYTRPVSFGELYDINVVDEWRVLYCRDRETGEIRLSERSTPGHPVPLYYYFNPGTRYQTWEVPDDTLLCSICNIDFAELYWSEENFRQLIRLTLEPRGPAHNILHKLFLAKVFHGDRVYCGGCFSEQIVHCFGDTWPWREFHFQLCFGGRTDYVATSKKSWLPCNWEVFQKYHQTPWERERKDFVEQERFLYYRTRHRELRMNKGRRCEYCDVAKAKWYCEECDWGFCSVCMKKKHRDLRRAAIGTIPTTNTSEPRGKNSQNKLVPWVEHTCYLIDDEVVEKSPKKKNKKEKVKSSPCLPSIASIVTKPETIDTADGDASQLTLPQIGRVSSSLHTEEKPIISQDNIPAVGNNESAYYENQRPHETPSEPQQDTSVILDINSGKTANSEDIGDEKRSRSKSRDKDGEKRSRSKSRDKDGEKRSRSKSRDKDGEKRSRSKSRDKDGEKRSRSKSRDKDGEKRSRSKSRDKDGEKCSRSKSRDKDGEKRSRSKSRDKDGEKRSRSKSRDKDGEKCSRSKSRDKDGEKRSRSKSRDKDGEKRSRSKSRDKDGEKRSPSNSRVDTEAV